MQADRLVAILLLLQARGRLTAPALAKELGVSVKTARRDLEALVASGFPVHPQAGRGGGWVLHGGARTDLSGLDASEARALFRVAGPGTSLDPAARLALQTLVHAIPVAAAEGDVTPSRAVLDPARWGRTEPEVDRDVDSPVEASSTAAPLVDIHSDRPEPAKLSSARRPKGRASLVRQRLAAPFLRLRAMVRTRSRSGSTSSDVPVPLESEAELVAHLREEAQAILRVQAAALEPLLAPFPGRLMMLGPDAGDTTAVVLSAGTLEMIAEHLAGRVADVEVVAPEEVRANLARIGAVLVDRYGDAV